MSLCVLCKYYEGTLDKPEYCIHRCSHPEVIKRDIIYKSYKASVIVTMFPDDKCKWFEKE